MDGAGKGEGQERTIPALVHLSGPRRGSTVRLRGERISVASDGSSAAVGERRSGGEPAAQLVRRGLTYQLRVTPGWEVWVNGERVEELTLATGDVVEVGRGGPILRFRLYESGMPAYKSVSEAFSDCLDCARYGSRSLLGRAGIFLASMPRELLTRTSPAFRSGVLAALLLLGGATAFLVHRSLELEDRLAAEHLRVEGLRSLVDRSGAGAVTGSELERLRTEVRRTLATARSRLDSLEARSAAPPRVIARTSGGVAFLQGSYRFVDPRTRRALRIWLGPDGEPTVDEKGNPSVVAGGDGPVLEPLFTGSAYLAADGGLAVTNRHLARPWEFDPAARALVARGFVPVMSRFVAWLPGVDERLEVETVAVSDSSDVAVLRVSGVPEGRPVLPLATDPPGPGEEVIVLGYPLGMRALMARAGTDFLGRLGREEALDFWEVARRLGSEGRIEPLASRGIVSQVNDDLVVYDAETTMGGSGGPVLNIQGQVVAVTTGTMPEFGGSNIGVSAARVRTLMERIR